METLKIFKSSAGSGKTFTLVLEYIKLILKQPEDYKAILAVTFTNKAAEEMKSRIIDALVSLSNGEESPIRKILENELPKTDLNSRASKALKNILHDYSSFSVSTIDSFFQRTLRALAREIDLPLNMEVEIELDDAILDVTDRLLKDVGVDNELTDWLTTLALQKMDDEKGWSLENDIKSVAKEIFREKLHNSKVLTRDQIHLQHQRLQKIKNSFEKKMKESGEHVLKEMEKYSLDISDFSYGAKGVAGYFQKITSATDPESYKIKGRVEEALSSAEKWVTKKHPRRNDIIELAENIFIPLLDDIEKFVTIEYKGYITAIELLKKIYLFGIVNDLQKKFAAYRNENHVILLSDTTRLLSDVIEGNDAPFLYEKTGNRYKHLLIDEFQDTSLLQWKNLLPLIINALGSGFMTLVVGDAKQSIYRWRGGNMNLLLQDLFVDLKNFNSLLKEEVLSVNYRSKKEIVDFNNDFFTHATELLNKNLEMNDFPLLKLAYGKDLKQNYPENNSSGGYVRIKFMQNGETEDGEKTKWKDDALIEMLSTIQYLLKKGYSYKDICVLVRKNVDGNEIANFLFQNGIEEIISPDSLLITASPRIGFLISVFRFLSDNSNSIARSEIILYYNQNISKQKEDELHRLFTDHKHSFNRKKSVSKNPTLFEGLEKNEFNRLLPQAFTEHISYLAKLPVYELSEQIIKIFGLNERPDAYIQRFQDLVLEYTAKSNSSIEGFLQWWDTNNKVRDCSVTMPGNTDAIRIMSVHKSKGLQFPIVLMPLTEWTIKPKANDIMWMDTAGTPFEELGSVAVNSSKRLSDTYFSEEYDNEINQTIIDNINLLYVAFTRAEEKLFVICPADNDKELNSISKMIYRTCLVLGDGSDMQIFEKGADDNRPLKKEKKEIRLIPELLASYPSTRWQEKLALSTHSGDLLSMLDNKQISKINYGILVHSVFAGIEYVKDIDLAVEKIVFDGLIGEEEMKQLKKEITEVLSVNDIAKYFDESYKVRAEREVILPGGEVLRPDRVIVKDEHAIVIDFKTGKREKKHEEQVSHYAGILREMKYSSVKGVLIYLSERAVVEI